MINPLSRTYAPYLTYNIALNGLGRVQEALDACNKGLVVAPEDPHLNFNRDVYTKFLVDQNDPVKIALRSNTTPQKVKDAILRALEDTSKPTSNVHVMPPRIDGKLNVAIWTGPAVEWWSPKSPKTTGIGGSETAVIELGKHLAALGHQVVVYSDCPHMDGIYDGVDYRHFGAFTGIDCDVFISSRQPSIMDAQVKAKLKLLWVHDIHVGQPHPKMHEWLLKFDKILCLSEWHKAFFLHVYKHVHPETVIVTRNGIDPARFAGEVPTKKNKLVFSSSANRGLDVMLKVFPRIRAEVPDAELHVFYGFESWLRTAQLTKSDNEIAQIEAYQKLMQAIPGVVYRGRVDQDTLAKEMLESKVWSYPTAFTETYCCHPDTLVSVPGDHRNGLPRVRIADLVGKSNFPVYAYDAKENRFKLGTCLWVAQTKVAEEMVALDLDDGSTLKLTPEHLVMNFDGEWVQAGNIQPGTRLMALHHRYNVMIKDATGRWEDESRLVGEWKEGRELLKTEHVNHLDPLRLDNSPDRLEVMTASAHHSLTHKGSYRSKRAVQQRVVGWHKWLDENKTELFKRLAGMGGKLWDKINALPPDERAEWIKNRALKKSETVRARRAADPAYDAAFIERCRENARRSAENRQNHKVLTVRRIPGGPVFDMEVAGLHNFVAEGVVIHNCITAIEAQAAACVPVTTQLAGLAETAKWGIRIDGNNNSQAYQDVFVKAVIDLLQHDDKRTAIAELGRAWALKLSWEQLAKEWEGMFHTCIEEVRVNVLPRYESMVDKAAA